MLFTTKSLGLLVALPLSLAYPTTESLTRRFVGGQCGLHVTQFQKNENGVGGSYQYDIRIFDAIQDTIGGVNRLEIPDVQTRSVDSQLPYTVEITSGLLDADPITFRYADQHWTTSSGQCKIRGYGDGNRDGDCHFSC